MPSVKTVLIQSYFKSTVKVLNVGIWWKAQTTGKIWRLTQNICNPVTLNMYLQCSPKFWHENHTLQTLLFNCIKALRCYLPATNYIIIYLKTNPKRKPIGHDKTNSLRDHPWMTSPQRGREGVPPKGDLRWQVERTFFEQRWLPPES